MMFLNKIAAILFCILFSISPSLALTGVPDLCESNASMNGVTNQTISLFSLPDGQGLSLNEAQIYNDGTTIDATITLEVLDFSGAPISDFPAEDMWLESHNGGMVSCALGTMADSNTDFNGQTTFSSALRAGGWSMSSCEVMINGMPLCQAPFDMYFNSADVNGDGTVNLIDLNMIATAFYFEFHYSVDFYPDGVLNLSDIGRFITAVGASCQ